METLKEKSKPSKDRTLRHQCKPINSSMSELEIAFALGYNKRVLEEFNSTSDIRHGANACVEDTNQDQTLIVTNCFVRPNLGRLLLTNSLFYCLFGRGDDSDDYRRFIKTHQKSSISNTKKPNRHNISLYQNSNNS